MFRKKKPENKPSPLETMGAAAFPVLPFPFNGVQVLCKVRCLNHLQMRACGDFGLIDISDNDDKKTPGLGDMIAVRNWQEALIKETLISPTFEEIQAQVYGQDNVITERKSKAEKIRQMIEELPNAEQKQYQDELNDLELYIGCLLPDDFMNAVTEWATGQNRSDIKRLTREMLLEAAILAKNGNDNPADHIDGEFLDFHREEINKAAWMVYSQYCEDKEKERRAGANGDPVRVVNGGPVKG